MSQKAPQPDSTFVSGVRYFISDGQRTLELKHALSHTVTDGNSAEIVVNANGEKVGFVTSGGYGHTIGKSLAMAMVNTDNCAPGPELSLHIVGVERTARVIEASPYDPTGQAMRG